MEGSKHVMKEIKGPHTVISLFPHVQKACRERMSPGHELHCCGAIIEKRLPLVHNSQASTDNRQKAG